MKSGLSCFLFLSFGLGAVTVASAQDWGFGKDTVYAWRAGGDSVWLVNDGPDTLRVDSLFAEEVDTIGWNGLGFNQGVESGFRGYALEKDLMTALPIEEDLILSGDSLLFFGFTADVYCPTAKPAASTASAASVGDTVQVLLRFRSQGQQEEDSLMVRAVYCSSTRIVLPERGSRRHVGDLPARDVLGRKRGPSPSSAAPVPVAAPPD